MLVTGWKRGKRPGKRVPELIQGDSKRKEGEGSDFARRQLRGGELVEAGLSRSGRPRKREKKGRGGHRSA